jgi:uncharacterized protein (DUF779 family)
MRTMRLTISLNPPLTGLLRREGSAKLASRSVANVHVVLTRAAEEALARVQEAHQDELSLVIGNGCCDSTAPFLFGAYVAGPNEARVGEVRGVPVLLDRALFELFEGREVVIDARSGAGEDSFSCETELGLRFSLERLPSISQRA